MATTLDSATKVNLGVFLTLLAAVGGGGMYLEHMETTLTEASKNLDEVKKSVDRITVQIGNDGKTLAVMVSRVDQQNRVIEALAKRVTDLEKAKE